MRKLLRACAPLLLSCSPELDVGAWTCPVTEGNEDGGAPSLLPPESETPLPVPWSSGFEDGFCGYYDGSGFCYSATNAGFRRVTQPVHTGRYAAAFDIVAIELGGNGNQARCVREGELPQSAYYGAWYFVPSGTLDLDNWNLFHFQGGRPNATQNLWDVSVRQNAEDELVLYLFDAEGGRAYTQASSAEVPIPTDRWFHIEFYWDRSEVGEVRLYQDGEEVLSVSDVVTEYRDWAQWYVGNLANALRPSRSTLYVDDVSVRLR